MRNAFAQAVIERCSGPEWFFLTGDLGFMALEGVRDALGERFINCGVAEQNMVSVAAGLAREGFRVLVYSIAPFCYARPFEQIRNDVCFGHLPVCLVGNGGGYGYGHMGPSHHALEDCAAMAALGVQVLVPAFDADIGPMLREMCGPTYLRLGYDIRPREHDVPTCAPWRRLLPGSTGVVATLGPLSGLAWKALVPLAEDVRPELWAVSQLPIGVLPDDFCASIAAGRHLAVFEEHVAQGGLGMNLLYALAERSIGVRRFEHRHALGYPSGRYGSQAFHRAECGLDADALLQLAAQWG